MIVGEELRDLARATGRRSAGPGPRSTPSPRPGTAAPSTAPSAPPWPRLDGPEAEDVAAVVANLFADDFWVDALIEGLAEALARRSLFRAALPHINSDIHNGLVVFEDDHVSIAAGRQPRRPARRQEERDAAARARSPFRASSTLFKFVKAGGARLSFWECPPITDGFQRRRPPAAASAPASASIEDGEILVVDGRRQSFVIEHAAANLVVLQATVKPGRAPLAVEYDSETRAYVGCSAADDSASRIQMITTLLRKLDCAAAFPAIAAFLDHPNFFVRWHVMKELLGLDAEAALPHLQADGRARPASRGAPRRPRRARPDRDRRRRQEGRLMAARHPLHGREGDRRSATSSRRSTTRPSIPPTRRASPPRAAAQGARQQSRLPRRDRDRRAQGPLHPPEPREPLFEPGDHAPPGVGEIFHPRQFLAVRARQRVQGERRLALLLPRPARPQFLVPHRRLSRPRLLERILRI